MNYRSLITGLADTQKYIGIRVLAYLIFVSVAEEHVEALGDCDENDVFLAAKLAALAEQMQLLRKKLANIGHDGLPDNDVELYRKLVVPLHQYLAARGK